LHGEIPATISITFVLSLSFLHLMKEEKEDMATSKTKERSFEVRISFEKIKKIISIQGFHFIYR